MRRAAKTDSNQSEIVRALREAGCGVLSLAALGKGAPDILVLRGGGQGYHYYNLMEIKDGTKPPSERKLTPAQVKFHREWPGHIHVVTSPAEALLAMGIES